jgi:hypothetical protein
MSNKRLNTGHGLRQLERPSMQIKDRFSIDINSRSIRNKQI